MVVLGSTETTGKPFFLYSGEASFYTSQKSGADDVALVVNTSKIQYRVRDTDDVWSKWFELDELQTSSSVIHVSVLATVQYRVVAAIAGSVVVCDNTRLVR